MPDNLRAAVGLAFCAAAAAGIGYSILALARMRAFRSRAPGGTSDVPPVSIFKPLHGDEAQLYENLRSFCDQDYPSFQIIFCAASPDDRALAIARRLKKEFPDRDICVVSGNAPSAANPKIANILGAYTHARHGILAIADSDICVGREYLRTLAEGFEDAQTGAVTCLYGASADGALPSRLGAMHVNDGFAPSVLVAQALEPLTYCFGATMAVRRDVLERAGGLAAMADHLGDDYRLGQTVAAAGYRVHLSRYVVHTHVSDATLSSLWRRELRWARTIRSARPAGFAGSFLTFPLPLALAAAIALPSGGTAMLLAAAATVRAALHFEGRKTFAPRGGATLQLVPLRDALSLAVWFSAFFGSGVRWRSKGYRVEAGGRMARGPDGM